ncbi:MAG: hypothetical protein ACI8ZM_004942 [Crocinitomix sp.]|jgi:hypothetical protein
MKVIVTIALVISTVFCFGQSSQNMGTNLENDFSKSILGEENVAAFEARAKQKVEDFCNYIQLVSNKGFDEKFRQHSHKSALSLFNSDQCLINDSIVTGVDSLVTISNFLDAVFETQFHQIEGQASQIILQDELTLSEDGNYAGTISYVQTLTCFDKAGIVIEKVVENKTVGVTLNRKTKSFGTTEKIIWVVELCDIN